jgi:hypothetical protein
MGEIKKSITGRWPRRRLHRATVQARTVHDHCSPVDVPDRLDAGMASIRDPWRECLDEFSMTSLCNVGQLGQIRAVLEIV